MEFEVQKGYVEVKSEYQLKLCSEVLYSVRLRKYFKGNGRVVCCI